MTDRSEILEEMRQWVKNDRNQSFQRDHRILAITKLLQQGPFADKEKALVGSHLGILSNWYLILGAVRIADGRMTGWTDLSHGMRIDYWHIRLLVEQWEKDTRKNKQPRMDLLRPSLCLAMAIAFDKREIADWLGMRLFDSLSDGTFGDWGEYKLPSFVLKLYHRYIGQVDKLSSTEYVDSDPYVNALADWDRDGDFAQAIQSMCDCHIKQSADSGDEYTGEFSRYPFNIVPVEIWAMERIRQREGLNMPKIEHPLLSAPFDSVPRDVPDATDQLLEKIASSRGLS